MFLEEENKMLKSMVDKIKDSGANVVYVRRALMISHSITCQGRHSSRETGKGKRHVQAC